MNIVYIYIYLVLNGTQTKADITNIGRLPGDYLLQGEVAVCRLGYRPELDGLSAIDREKSTGIPFWEQFPTGIHGQCLGAKSQQSSTQAQQRPQPSIRNR